MILNEYSCSCLNCFYWFSTAYVLVKLLGILWTFVKEYVLPYFMQSQDFKHYGQWAVITGSTDGIGKGFAEELASKGVDVCLISRTEEKLKNVAQEIEKNYGVKTKYIVADFTNPNIYGHIKESLSDLDIGILVNNVGTGEEAFQPFSNFSEQVIRNYLNTCLLSVNMMTNIVLPCMIEKKRGLILNMSSFGSEIICPYVAEYCACKSFITTFGICLSHELKQHNIQVTTFVPGAINSRFVEKYTKPGSMSKKLTSLVATPVNTFVRSALLTVSSGTYKTCGYLAHYITLLWLQLIPTEVLLRVINYVKKIKL